MLRDILIPLNVTVKVEKETDNSKPDKETVPIPQEETEPRLPSLPTLVVEDSVEEIDYSPPSKIQKKSVDTDDRLADIICTGETKMNNSAAAEMELNRYFGCKLTEADYNLTLLEWWKKMKVIFLVYHRLPKFFSSTSILSSL